ncbi:MAG: hypothetical protein RIF36_00020 [Imperialibacter sp.]|uniref:hypothetical protein n=1 Tax=Imperialibacter sp. TaxID=2038411 RepID=UPI0032F087C2
MGNNSSKILSSLASITKGKSYRSFRYCLEDVKVPSVEYDDRKDIVFKKSGESDKGIRRSRSVEKLAKYIAENDAPLLRFFLDGSRRTYKVDDIAYGGRLYPIIAGQIGVGCCERINPDRFSPTFFERALVVSVPVIANPSSQDDKLFFNNLTGKINDGDFLKNSGIYVGKILPYSDRLKEGEKYEHKGISSIHDEMLESEKRLVKKLALERKLHAGAYLVKDGSLEYQRMPKTEFSSLSAYKSNYACVIGVSKAFNPEALSSNVKDIAKIIAELKPFERTPAFKYQTPRVGDAYFAIWYLRLRDTASPFDGVVKVEKVLVSEKEESEGLDSDEIDKISANLMNERFPVSYGKDSRWAKHIYPIHLTESYIKSHYLSDIHFENLF